MTRQSDATWMWQGGFDKIPHLEDIPEIMACRRVVVLEKIHGICWFAGFRPEDSEITYADRWQAHSETSPLGHIVKWFSGKMDWTSGIRSLAVQTGQPVVVIGEMFGNLIYGQPAENTYGTLIPYLDYGCDMDFRVHDLRIAGSAPDWSEIEAFIQKAGLPLAPKFYSGVPDLHVFESLLGKTVLVKNEPRGEGLVIRSDPLVKNKQGQYLIGKMKVGEYAEINSRTDHPLPVPTGAAPSERLAIEYASQQRISKAVARLIGNGNFTNTREDLFALTDLVIEDIALEAPAAWHDAVAASTHDEAEVRKAIQKMTKYWYEQALRRKLLGKGKTERQAFRG